MTWPVTDGHQGINYLTKWGRIHGRDVRGVLVTHLPKTAIASTIISLFNAYTEGMTDLLQFGAEFLLYTLVIFVGFVVVNMVLETESDNRGG